MFNDFNPILSKQTLNEVFALWEKSPDADVMLDGKPIKISTEAVVLSRLLKM